MHCCYCSAVMCNCPLHVMHSVCQMPTCAEASNCSRDRAALAPFRANQTIGLDSYSYILYGDDDTVWFPENVLRLVNGLDHTMPFVLSDHMWFPEWKGGL